MRTLLGICFLSILAVLGALAARFDPGNIVIFFPPYRIDLSLNLFVLLLILLFVGLYLIARAMSTVATFPSAVARYRATQIEQKAQRNLLQSLLSYFEGRFGQAQKHAQEVFDSPAQLISHERELVALVAARSAHHMQQFSQRDHWFELAAQGKINLATQVSRAQMLVDEHQPQEALIALEQAHQSGARHLYAMRLALKAHQQLANWREVIKLTRVLEKHKAFNSVAAQRLRELAYAALIEQSKHSVTQLDAITKMMDESAQRKPLLARKLAQAWCLVDQPAQAAQVLERALQIEYDETVLLTYLNCVPRQVNASTLTIAGEYSNNKTHNGQLLSMIEHAQNWVTQYSHYPAVHFVLARLCMHKALWGKAQTELKIALGMLQSQAQHKPNGEQAHLSAQVHLALGEIFDASEKPQEALQEYRLSALLQKTA